MSRKVGTHRTIIEELVDLVLILIDKIVQFGHVLFFASELDVVSEGLQCFCDQNEDSSGFFAGHLCNKEKTSLVTETNTRH
jgi:hypothetical protein